MTRKTTSDDSYGCSTVLLASVIALIAIFGGFFVTTFLIEHRVVSLVISIITISVFVVGLIVQIAIRIKRKPYKNSPTNVFQQNTKYINATQTDHHRVYKIDNQATDSYHTISRNVDFESDGTIIDEWSQTKSDNLVDYRPEQRVTKKKSKSWDDYKFKSGRDFEYFCAKLLKCNGFTNVEITQASKDKGVDIIAWRKNVKYAIQCKCYSDNNVGIQAVQEVYTGKALYGCQKAMVMTNSKFTEEAREAGSKLGVTLLNGITLSEWSKHMK